MRLLSLAALPALSAPLGCTGADEAPTQERAGEGRRGSIEETAPIEDAASTSAPDAAARPALTDLPPDGKACPPGMLRVRGEGTLGMKEDVYAIVETAHLDVVEAPEERCPQAIDEHPLSPEPGPASCWVQTDLVDPVVPPRRVEVDVCIERFPFPGRGLQYTRDGMTAWDAQRLAELLGTGRFGTRRLCTFSEFQAAVAGLASNNRFVYGDRHDPARCPADGAVGADPQCTNAETGVHDYAAVQSHWVVADADFVAHACPQPPCLAAGHKPLREGHLVVAGGTARLQTRQAPLTPHTWHDHGDPVPVGCDAMGHDDQPVICATPDPRYSSLAVEEVQAQEAAWGQLLSVARETGSMTRFLEEGLGRPLCQAEE